MKYEYWKSDKNGNWYWHLKAGNNQIIANGEGYKNKADVLAVIKLVKGSASAPEINLTPSAA
jgi:uncharacterized protein YegP (UPF0339 family)